MACCWPFAVKMTRPMYGPFLTPSRKWFYKAAISLPGPSVGSRNRSRIAKLSETLRIDVRDMVLIDDSEWEIAEVTEQVSLDNRALCFGRIPLRRSWSKGCGCCRRIKTSKTGCACKPIKTMKKREALRRSAGSYEAFLQKTSNPAYPAGGYRSGSSAYQ